MNDASLRSMIIVFCFLGFFWWHQEDLATLERLELLSAEAQFFLRECRYRAGTHVGRVFTVR